MISGISVSPKRQPLNLYYYLFYDNIGQEEVCLFLRHLIRHLSGRRIVLLDNSSTHKGQPLQELLRRNPRLQIENFPSYAPELNPDEGVGLMRSENCPILVPRTLTNSWRTSSGR